MLKTKTVGAKATVAGIEVSFEGEQAPPAGSQVYDLVLVSVGRSPNGKKIGAEKAGVAVTERGFIYVDKQMRTNVAHIFAIGDIVGQPMLAHKAVHEGHAARAKLAHPMTSSHGADIAVISHSTSRLADTSYRLHPCLNRALRTSHREVACLPKTDRVYRLQYSLSASARHRTSPWQL